MSLAAAACAPSADASADAQIPGLGVLCRDHHYKYLVPLLVPTTAWFAIANWVGWQYFRYA